MSILRSLAANTAARSVTEIVNRAGSAIFWIILARYLGAEALGSFAFALSLFSLFELFATLGLGSVVIRDIAQNRGFAGKYFSQAMILGLFSSVIFAGIMIGISALLKPNSDTIYTSIILAFALLPATGFYWSRAILWAKEKLTNVAIARTAENAFKIVFGIGLLFAGAGVREIAVILALSKIVSFVICYLYARKLVQPEWQIYKSVLISLIKQVPVFSATAIFNGLFWSSSVIILTKIGGETQAGYFSAAYKLIDLCIAFATAYGQALFPIASKVSAANRRLLTGLCKKSIKYLFIFSIGVACGTSILADKIILLFYGNSLSGAIPLLRLLIWMVVPFSLIPVLAYVLVSNHMQKKDLYANATAAIALFVASIVLIPLKGAAGATIALLIGSCLFFAVEFYAVSKSLFKFTFSAHQLIPILGVGLMSVCVFYLKDSNLFLSSITGALVYITFLLAAGIVTSPEIRLVRELRSY
jgi:O-antigen/teichoic acid export membrane protein